MDQRQRASHSLPLSSLEEPGQFLIQLRSYSPERKKISVLNNAN